MGFGDHLPPRNTWWFVHSLIWFPHLHIAMEDAEIMNAATNRGEEPCRCSLFDYDFTAEVNTLLNTGLSVIPYQAGCSSPALVGVTSK